MRFIIGLICILILLCGNALDRSEAEAAPRDRVREVDEDHEVRETAGDLAPDHPADAEDEGPALDGEDGTDPAMEEEVLGQGEPETGWGLRRALKEMTWAGYLVLVLIAPIVLACLVDLVLKTRKLLRRRRKHRRRPVIAGRPPARPGSIVEPLRKLRGS